MGMFQIKVLIVDAGKEIPGPVIMEAALFSAASKS
jgi:hypothetical protein